MSYLLRPLAESEKNLANEVGYMRRNKVQHIGLGLFTATRCNNSHIRDYVNAYIFINARVHVYGTRGNEHDCRYMFTVSAQKTMVTIW
jgi:CO/xanthine dehydrogenase FAD-binding subunit